MASARGIRTRGGEGGRGKVARARGEAFAAGGGGLRRVYCMDCSCHVRAVWRCGPAMSYHLCLRLEATYVRAREAEPLRTRFGDKGHEDKPTRTVLEDTWQPRQHLHVPQYACISGAFITRGTSNVKGGHPTSRGEHPTSRGGFQRQGVDSNVKGWIPTSRGGIPTPKGHICGGMHRGHAHQCACTVMTR